MNEHRYIDAMPLRNKLNDSLSYQYRATQGGQFDNGICETLADFILELDEQPTAEVAPVIHASWVPDPFYEEVVGGIMVDLNDTKYLKHYKCSKCGRRESCADLKDPYESMPYCHCGAKMDKESSNKSPEKIERCPYCGGLPELKRVGDNKQFSVYECKDCFKTPVKNNEARLTEYGARLIWNKRAGDRLIWNEKAKEINFE